MHHRRITLAAAALVLAACGDDQPVTSPTDETATTTTTVVPSTIGDSPTPAPTTTSSSSVDVSTTAPAKTTTEVPMTTTPSGSSVDVAVADLAERLDVAADQITVVVVEEVTWRDGSLGCPEPDRVYTQALVNGQRIVLAVDGIEYEYHSGGSRAPFYCPPQYVQSPASEGARDPNA